MTAPGGGCANFQTTGASGFLQGGERVSIRATCCSPITSIRSQIQKRYGNNNGQQFIPLCAGAARVDASGNVVPCTAQGVPYAPWQGEELELGREVRREYRRRGMRSRDGSLLGGDGLAPGSSDRPEPQSDRHRLGQRHPPPLLHHARPVTLGLESGRLAPYVSAGAVASSGGCGRRTTPSRAKIVSRSASSSAVGSPFGRVDGRARRASARPRIRRSMPVVLVPERARRGSRRTTPAPPRGRRTAGTSSRAGGGGGDEDARRRASPQARPQGLVRAPRARRRRAWRTRLRESRVGRQRSSNSSSSAA